MQYVAPWPSAIAQQRLGKHFHLSLMSNSQTHWFVIPFTMSKNCCNMHISEQHRTKAKHLKVTVFIAQNTISEHFIQIQIFEVMANIQCFYSRC